MRALALVGCAVIAVAIAACGDEKELQYVEANIAIWHALPAFPDATILQQGNSPYYEGEGGPVIGYTTNVTYTVSQDTKAEDVIQFYVDVLGGDWAHCEHDQQAVSVSPPGQTPGTVLGTVLVESFSRDGASITVGTFGLSEESGPSRQYELAIDHEAKDDPCSGFPIVG